MKSISSLIMAIALTTAFASQAHATLFQGECSAYSLGLKTNKITFEQIFTPAGEHIQYIYADENGVQRRGENIDTNGVSKTIIGDKPVHIETFGPKVSSFRFEGSITCLEPTEITFSQDIRTTDSDGDKEESSVVCKGRVVNPSCN